MAGWSEMQAQAPELAARARERFDAFTHKTIATLRRDGSPRISGTEVEFSDGELFIGSMWGAVKARDLQRDPRFALHSGSQDPPEWPGDAKIAGRMVEVTEERGRSHRFRADIEELVVIGLNEARDRLVIESWHAGKGLERTERA